MVLYTLTKTQFDDINFAMPAGHSFGYRHEDGTYIFDGNAQAYYNFDLNPLFEPETITEFLESLPVRSENNSIQEYRIGAYADDHHRDTPFNLFNFKTMLKRNISTNKEITMLANGRPGHASYYINDELVAYIYFAFNVNSDGLMTRRTEELVYIDDNDGESPRIIIKDKIFDLTNPSITDSSIVLQERINSRENIIGNMKMITGAVLKGAYGYTLDEVSNHIEPFWSEFTLQRIDFIDLGSNGLNEKIAAINLETTAYPWLNLPVQPGLNIRDFMLVSLFAYYESVVQQTQ